MKYLFDTDAISNLLRPSPPRGLVERISAVPASDQFISTISILEITYGAYRSSNPHKYLDFLESVVLPRVRVLGLDETAARMAGRIRADRQRAGRPIAPFDLQIAAIAQANGCIVVTGNTRHFEDIAGLETEDWIR